MTRFPGIVIACAFLIGSQAMTSCSQPAPATGVQRLRGGFSFLEGPAWDERVGGLIFSDLRARRIYRMKPGSEPDILVEASDKANGNVLLPSGDLISCEHQTHCIALRRADGTREVLVDQFEGKALNSPNDLVQKSDGTIWFTDPDYGLGGRAKEQAHNNVFVFNPATRDLRAVVSDFDMPNGLCFSPDETKLYIADSGSPHHIRVFDVTRDNQLANGRVFSVISPGHPDGIRCDAKGNVWSSAGNGIHVLDASGKVTNVIEVPETPANLCFGGPNNRTLFITARTSVYATEIR